MGTNTETSAPRVDIPTLIETIVRKFGNYAIKTPVGERDIINSDTDYADYFDDAFGSGLAISHEFDTMLTAIGFKDHLKALSKSGSKGHTDVDTDRKTGTVADTGTIGDSGSHTATDTPVNTITTTPTGTKTVQTTYSNSGEAEGKLGAWNGSNYQGANKDETTNSGTATETTTGGTTETITHSGKAKDLSESMSNTRTLNTTKTYNTTDTINKTGSENYSESVTLDWTVEDLQTYVSMAMDLDVYNWIAREIVYDVAWTEKGVYII